MVGWGYDANLQKQYNVKAAHISVDFSSVFLEKGKSEELLANIEKKTENNKTSNAGSFLSTDTPDN